MTRVHTVDSILDPGSLALFNRSGGQQARLFMIAAGALVIALLLELGIRMLNPRPRTAVPTHTLTATGLAK